MPTPLPRHIAVIDIGKTNAKVVLFDARTGRQLDVLTTPNAVRRVGPYPHADVEALWAFICDSLKRLHARHGVEGISITTHGATAALIDGNDLVLPVLDYEHQGPETSADAYARVRPDFAHTLSPRLPNGLNLGAQLFWQAREFPGAFARATAILSYPQYWAWRLTGQLASEVTSLGCHTDLWSPDRSDYSHLVDEMGWRQLFPPIRPANSILGRVTEAVAERTGLPRETPVTCGIHDSNASLLPHLQEGETPLSVVSSGTWTIVMTIGGGTSKLDPQRDSLANVDAFGRPVPTARFMGGREFDTLVPGIAEPSAADIEQVLAADVQALPSVVPGVGPFGARRASWTVDPENLPDGMRTAAASFYLALMTRECLSLCGLGKRVVIEGPLARNRLFVSALAQLLGVLVSTSADGTGTSLGASLLFPGAGGAHSAEAVVEPLQADGLEAYAQRWLQRAARP
ncbi:FGGY-family carbohydrate kinase [Devosia sp. PTR5]|uniref:FGGY-family carbohydrate kinase n=1 Tax=Devosia oryzisoli TaxID=2774138 RepID=A0A927FV12_9HYPH|nr:FGGY-family carbohydrate kinase [Devosia oryzisoli]MBD8065303.1 FGGY-family carbohydrate kinase [Devosia oryzisoli]